MYSFAIPSIRGHVLATQSLHPNFFTFFDYSQFHMDPKLKEAIQAQKPALDDGKSAGLPPLSTL